jgi:hypothetical protein
MFGLVPQLSSELLTVLDLGTVRPNTNQMGTSQISP